MNQYGKAIRLGGVVIACALLLRLGNAVFFQSALQLLTNRTAASVLLFLETGHVLRPVEFSSPTQPSSEETQLPTEAVQPSTEATPQATQPNTKPDQGQAVTVFSPEDANLVQVHSYCGYDADVPAWLSQPLQWDLTQPGPTVLIVHSHTSESYENTQGYQESSDYRTLDENYNVIAVGDALVRLLEAGGLQVLHDRQLHDHPSYSDAYQNSRASIRKYLQDYPSIRLVMDIHRDSVTDSEGNQLKYTVETGDRQAAQLMLVVGTDAGGLNHAHWPENMSLAVKFHAQLEKLCPGICRPISFRTQRFNQDLSTGALLVEVGSAGNTLQEALTATEYLAQAVLDLAGGTG